MRSWLQHRCSPPSSAARSTAAVLLGAGVGRRRRRRDGRPAGAARGGAPAAATARRRRADRARDLQARRARRRVHPRRDRCRPTQSPFDFVRSRAADARRPAPGFVIDDDGPILTNAHVVEGATDDPGHVRRQADGRGEAARQGPSTDLALLKVDPDGLDLEPLELGDSDDASRSATRRSRSATRSGSTARSRPASCPRCSAGSTRRTASRSTTSSRPTPRSTRATPAAR